MRDVYELLASKIDEARVKLDEPMSKHTSFRIGGPADVFVKVENVQELKHVLEVAKNNDMPLTVIR